MSSDYQVLAIVFLVSVVIRDTYEYLKERRKLNPENRIVFALILTVMCALWISWFSLSPLEPLPMDLHWVLRGAGGVVSIIGTLLAVGALIQLRGVENITHLVTTGLFSKIRHPMYVGFICWIAGWSVYHASPLGMVVGIPGIISVLWWRHLEEGRLTKQFGSAYQNYKQTTWF